MEDVLEKIKVSVEDALKEKNISVTNISYRKEGKNNFLEIELDQDGGMDLDSIVDATGIINPIIDKLDLIDDSYILDIVSKERG